MYTPEGCVLVDEYGSSRTVPYQQAASTSTKFSTTQQHLVNAAIRSKLKQLSAQAGPADRQLLDIPKKQYLALLSQSPATLRDYYQETTRTGRGRIDPRTKAIRLPYYLEKALGANYRMQNGHPVIDDTIRMAINRYLLPTGRVLNQQQHNRLAHELPPSLPPRSAASRRPVIPQRRSSRRGSQSGGRRRKSATRRRKSVTRRCKSVTRRRKIDQPKKLRMSGSVLPMPLTPYADYLDHYHDRLYVELMSVMTTQEHGNLTNSERKDIVNRYLKMIMAAVYANDVSQLVDLFSGNNPDPRNWESDYFRETIHEYSNFYQRYLRE
jgi:hypothetical protein